MSVELVGVLNVTPDSFSDGGEFIEPVKAYERVCEMFDQGADIIDIGGEATNPYARPITVEQEWRRLEPVIKLVLPKYNGKISIDTRHPEIAQKVAEYGSFILNDVTTFRNPKMIEVAARHKLACIASHLPFAAQGDIQFAHEYLQMNDSVHVYKELEVARQAMIDGGIPEDNIILDPGIGFGKSMALNWELLEFPRKVSDKQRVMIGPWRKRFLATDPHTGRPVEGIDRKSIEVNLRAARIAILCAKNYKSPLLLRAHDVPEARQLIDEFATAA